MRRATLGVAMALAAAAASVTLGADIAPGSRSERLLIEINTVRARHGLGSLRADPRLAAAASAHAADMAKRDFFDHRGPDGAGLAGRVTRAGYAYGHVAENIAGGQRRAEQVVASWMSSAGHRRNLLNAEAVDAGIGYVDAPDDGGGVRYRHYWVAIFGRGPR